MLTNTASGIHPTAREMDTLHKAALGKIPCDRVIINCSVMNVYTGEILEHQAIGIKGRHIALTGSDLSHTIGDETQVIDANGQTAIPGFIEGHMHLVCGFTPYEFLKYAMKGGTTTIVSETMEIFPVAGMDGVEDFLDALQDQPIKILATAPAMASISQDLIGVDETIIESMAKRNDIIGIGESYWQTVLQNPDRFLRNFETMLKAGKTLEGHSAGAKGDKLAAYAGLGISSCHEPITAEEVVERLRMGIYVMIREGSIRRDMEAIARVRDMGIDFRRLLLTTDGVSPQDLMEKGFMEYLVQKGIDCGFRPMDAVRMATLNVAEHFGLDGCIGGIGPGKIADIVLIPDPHTIAAQWVISNGQVIVRDGTLQAKPRKHEFQPNSLHTIHLPDPVSPDLFSIPVDPDSVSATVRVMEMVTDLVTREAVTQLPVIQGNIQVDAQPDLAYVAAVDRTHHPGQTAVGLIKGFGLTAGAFASSAPWDCSCIIVVGKSPADMARAVNRIRQLQGAVVVSYQESIIAELPLPVFGIMSPLPVDQLAGNMLDIKQAVQSLGVTFPDPILTLNTLTGAAIPFLRICEQGLVHLKNGTPASPIIDTKTE